MRKTTIVAATLMLALCGGAASAADLTGAAGTQERQRVDLEVRKRVYPGAVRVGDPQTFTVKVTNGGTSRAERVRMRDPLPLKVRFVRASTSRHVPGSCGVDDRVVACRLGNLRPDRAVTVKIHVEPVVTGPYTNRAYASPDGPGALGAGVPGDSDAARALVEPARN